MAIAMEVSSWRGSEQGTSPSKKRAWGADAHQLMQLMMGQLQTQLQPEAASPDFHAAAPPAAELTLDLFGRTADPRSAGGALQLPPSPGFLHLDPRGSEPLPSDAATLPDLQIGSLQFANTARGTSAFDEPRNGHRGGEMEAQPQTHAYEFLGSKKSETLREESLKASSSSSSGSPRPVAHLAASLSSGRELRNLQLIDRHGLPSGSGAGAAEASSKLELDLNLGAGGSPPPGRPAPQQQPEALQGQAQAQAQQTVCTMEMIQNALRRSEQATGRREQSGALPRLRLKSSVSSSFSSLTPSSGARSAEPCGAEASTSSSSSASSWRSGSGASLDPAGSGRGRAARPNRATPGVCEGESMKGERAMDPGALVMGACTRCLMYVMLNKCDPRCPRCDSRVPVDFSNAPPPAKRRRGGVRPGYGSR